MRELALPSTPLTLSSAKNSPSAWTMRYTARAPNTIIAAAPFEPVSHSRSPFLSVPARNQRLRRQFVDARNRDQLIPGGFDLLDDVGVRLLASSEPRRSPGRYISSSKAKNWVSRLRRARWRRMRSALDRCGGGSLAGVMSIPLAVSLGGGERSELSELSTSCSRPSSVHQRKD